MVPTLCDWKMSPIFPVFFPIFSILFYFFKYTYIKIHKNCLKFKSQKMKIPNFSSISCKNSLIFPVCSKFSYFCPTGNSFPFFPGFPVGAETMIIALFNVPLHCPMLNRSSRSWNLLRTVIRHDKILRCTSDTVVMLEKVKRTSGRY